MARIVTYVHHCKRPDRKRKALALAVPTVVATKRAAAPSPDPRRLRLSLNPLAFTTRQRSQAQRAAP
jgi:hypothetical protein